MADLKFTNIEEVKKADPSYTWRSGKDVTEVEQVPGGETAGDQPTPIPPPLNIEASESEMLRKSFGADEKIASMQAEIDRLQAESKERAARVEAEWGPDAVKWMQSSQNEAVKSFGESLANPQVDIYDRNAFEKILFDKIGGNPFLIDPMAEVRKSDRYLPQLFEKTFRGQATWGDLPNLTAEQRKIWQQTVNAFHAQVKQEAASKQQQLYRAYKYGMEQWEWQVKRAQAGDKAARDRLMAEYKANGRIPTFRVMQNDRGEWTWHKWNMKTGMFEDTGKVGKKSDAMSGMNFNQAMAILRQFGPKKAGTDPMQMITALLAMNSTDDPEEKKRILSGALQDRGVDPQYKQLYDIALAFVKAYAGLGTEIESAGPIATPIGTGKGPAVPAAPPSNYRVFRREGEKGAGIYNK